MMTDYDNPADMLDYGGDGFDTPPALPVSNRVKFSRAIFLLVFASVFTDALLAAYEAGGMAAGLLFIRFLVSVFSGLAAAAGVYGLSIALEALIPVLTKPAPPSSPPSSPSAKTAVSPSPPAVQPEAAHTNTDNPRLVRFSSGWRLFVDNVLLPVPENVTPYIDKLSVARAAGYLPTVSANALDAIGISRHGDDAPAAAVMDWLLAEGLVRDGGYRQPNQWTQRGGAVFPCPDEGM